MLIIHRNVISYQRNLFETFKDQVNIAKLQFDKEVSVASLSRGLMRDYPDPVSYPVDHLSAGWTKADGNIISHSAPANKSAVGIVLKGCVIECFLPGVEAGRSLRKGDTLIEIDGEVVDENSASLALIGNDKAGTFVTLKCQSAPSGVPWGNSFVQETKEKTVKLKRMPAEALTDRRNLLEYLRQLKVQATNRHDVESALVHKCLKEAATNTLRGCSECLTTTPVVVTTPRRIRTGAPAPPPLVPH